MTDLATLTVRLEAQTAQFNKEMASVNTRLKKFEGAVGSALKYAAGAFAGFQLVSFGKNVINAADNLHDLSKITGVAVEDLSRLEYAAKLNGSSIEGLAVGLKKLARNSAEAADGGLEQAEAFAKLGINVKTADNELRPLTDILADVADKFTTLKDGAAKAAVAQEIFGKAGADMIPLLNEGSEGIAKMGAAADALGITLSTDAADSASDFNDALDTMKMTSEGAGRELVVTLLPALTALVKLMATASSVASTVFNSIGKGIGGTAAAAVSFVTGDVKQAREILRLMDEDLQGAGDKLGKRLDVIWAEVSKPIRRIGDEYESLPATLEKAAKGTTKAAKEVKTAAELFAEALDALNDSTATPLEKEMDALSLFKTQLGQLKSVSAISAEVYETRWQEALQSVNSDTQTALESQLAQLDEFEAKLNALLNAGIIDPATWRLRMAEALDGALQEVEVSAKKIGPTLIDELNKVSEFQLQFARNTVDIIAGTINDGFEGGIKGMLASFEKMINQLVAQALAAKIGEKLFGGIAAGGSGSMGGIVGQGLSWLGKLFGGSMDSGGHGEAGKAYAIGTGAQPELFIPKTAGTFYPKGGMGGVTQNIYVQGTYNERTGQQIARDASNRQRQASRLS